MIEKIELENIKIFFSNKQVLFGALLTAQPTENTNNVHIADLLDGPLQEEGDDLSDRFESEAP